MANFLLGRKAKLYYSTTLLDGTNTDTVLAAADEAGNIMDLSLELDSEFVDITTRAEAANGWSSEVAVLRSGRITFDSKWLPSDAFAKALVDVWNGVTEEIAIFALDQDKAVIGAQGLVGNFTVGMSKDEELRDIQKGNVTLAVSSFPDWYEVPSP